VFCHLVQFEWLRPFMGGYLGGWARLKLKLNEKIARCATSRRALAERHGQLAKGLEQRAVDLRATVRRARQALADTFHLPGAVGSQWRGGCVRVRRPGCAQASAVFSEATPLAATVAKQLDTAGGGGASRRRRGHQRAGPTCGGRGRSGGADAQLAGGGARGRRRATRRVPERAL
jgi:hypothetical protein